MFTREQVLNAMISWGLEFKLPEGDEDGWVMWPEHLREIDYLNKSAMDPRVPMFRTHSSPGFGISSADHAQAFLFRDYRGAMILAYDMSVFLKDVYQEQLDPNHQGYGEHEPTTWQAFEEASNYKEEMYRRDR